MGLRFQKRVNLSKGVGLNLSSTGVSASHRSKYGSIGSKGFSIKTGIPGLTFRQNFNKKNGAISFIIFSFAGFFIIVAIAIWNVGRFSIWCINELYKFILRQLEKQKNKDNL